jgi:hypothetical protein
MILREVKGRATRPMQLKQFQHNEGPYTPGGHLMRSVTAGPQGSQNAPR